MSSHTIDTAMAKRIVKASAIHGTSIIDKWFLEQVEIGLAEADDPAAEWVTNEEANASWTQKRAKLVKRAEGNAA